MAAATSGHQIVSPATESVGWPLPLRTKPEAGARRSPTAPRPCWPPVRHILMSFHVTASVTDCAAENPQSADFAVRASHREPHGPAIVRCLDGEPVVLGGEHGWKRHLLRGHEYHHGQRSRRSVRRAGCDLPPQRAQSSGQLPMPISENVRWQSRLRHHLSSLKLGIEMQCNTMKIRKERVKCDASSLQGCQYLATTRGRHDYLVDKRSHI